MTVDDYVKSIHVFSERNPRPVIARFYLGPQTGKAEINTQYDSPVRSKSSPSR